MKNTSEPISIDTNIVVRLCVYDIPEQAEAVTRLIESQQRIHVADIAIIESTFVLTRYYQLPRERVCLSLRALISQPNINCNRALFEKAFALYEKHPALSIEDCCLAVYAQLIDAKPLLTFDKKLAKQLQHVDILT